MILGIYHFDAIMACRVLPQYPYTALRRCRIRNSIAVLRDRNSDRLHHLCDNICAAANLLVKAAEKESQGPVLASGSKQPPTRVFMDDMTITA